MKIHLKQFLQTMELVAVPILVAAGVPPALAGDVKAGMMLAEKASDASQKTNEEKKAIALDATRVAIQATNDARPGTLDPSMVMGLAGNAIDTTIGAVDLIHQKVRVAPR